MEHMITASHHYQKEANRNLIMNVLRRGERVSRADLARITGLKRSTITHMVQELLAHRLVIEGEVGSASPQGGRKPIALQLNDHFGYIIGIDMDRYTCNTVLLDIQGNVVEEYQEMIPTSGSDAVEYIPAVIKSVYRHFSSTSRDHLRKIIAIGLGISGTVDPREGIIMESRLHNLYQRSIKEILVDIPVPVLIENDANCSAWAEIVLASDEKHIENGIYLLPRISHDRRGIANRVEIGGAVIVNGTVWHGSRFITGEFSMNSWFCEGVEQISSLKRSDFLRIEEEPALLEKCIFTVLAKLVTAARMLDPDKIILGGVFAEHTCLVKNVVAQELQNTWYLEDDHISRLIPAEFYQQSVALGAGAYVLSRLYRMPQVGEQQMSPFDISWDHVVSS